MNRLFEDTNQCKEEMEQNVRLASDWGAGLGYEGVYIDGAGRGLSEAMGGPGTGVSRLMASLCSTQDKNEPCEFREQEEGCWSWDGVSERVGDGK